MATPQRSLVPTFSIPKHYLHFSSSPQVVCDTLIHLHKFPPRQSDLDTNEHIRDMLGPIFRRFEAQSLVDITTLLPQREGSMLIRSAIKTAYLNDVIRTVVKLMNCDPARRKRSEVYQYTLKPYEEEADASAVAAPIMRLDVTRGRIVHSGSKEYQMKHYGFYIGLNTIAPNVASFIGTQKTEFPEDLTEFFGPLCKQFDDKAKVRAAAIPGGCPGTVFIHTQIPFISLGTLVEAAFNTLRQNKIHAGIIKRYRTQLPSGDALSLTDLKQHLIRILHQFKVREATTFDLEEAFEKLRQMASPNQFSRMLSTGANAWRGAQNAIEAAIADAGQRYPCGLGSTGFKKDEEGLSIYVLTAHSKADAHHLGIYPSLCTLSRDVEEFVHSRADIIPGKLNDMLSVKNFLGDVVRQYDKGAKVKLSPSINTMLVRTNINHMAMERIVHSALVAANLGEKFPHGYQSSLKIIYCPSAGEERYEHEVSLEKNKLGNLSSQDTISLVRGFLVRNQKLIPDDLTLFSNIQNLLLPLFQLFDPKVEVRPVYICSPIQPATFIATSLSQETIQNILQYIFATYNESMARQSYCHQLAALPTDAGKRTSDTFLLAVHPQGTPDSDFLQKELQGLEKAVSAYVAFNPAIIPHNLTDVSTVIVFLNQVIHHIDKQAKIRSTAHPAPGASTHAIETRLHPLAVKKVVERALKAVYLDPSFPWGLEMQLKPMDYSQKNNLYNLELGLNRKPGVTSDVVHTLNQVRLLLIKRRDLLERVHDSSATISSYLNTLFSELDLQIKVIQDKKVGANTFSFLIKTEENFLSLSSLIETAFQIYRKSQPEGKFGHSHKLNFLEERRCLRDVDFTNAVSPGARRRAAVDHYSDQTYNVYQLEVDIGTCAGFEVINIEDIPLTQGVHENFMDVSDLDVLRGTLHTAYKFATQLLKDFV